MPDDVTRRGDADPVDVKRNALLLREARGLQRRSSVVVRAVGDQKNPGERLPALNRAAEHLYERWIENLRS